MSLNNIVKRFADLGCGATVNGEGIDLDIGDAQIHITFDPSWLEAALLFHSGQTGGFNAKRRVLATDRSIEYLVVRLDPGFYFRVNHKFSDASRNTVILSEATKAFPRSELKEII